MPTFDWIVVGNGLTGAALSCELARQGHSVLVLDQSPAPDSATRYSYGGVPFWSGQTALWRQLCRESRQSYGALPEKSGIDIEYRELDLLLTVDREADPQRLAQRYAAAETPPQPITPEEAIAREPNLIADHIAGALFVRHGHVNPMAVVKAYNRCLQDLGGRLVIAPVTGLVHIGDRVTGVTTPTQAYAAANVAIAAGGLTRELLKTAGVKVPVYFTHAEIIETPPLDADYRALIMPADLTRSAIESEATDGSADLWDEPNHEVRPPFLDSGFVQFRDRTVRLGQISRVTTNLNPQLDATASEQKLRDGIAPLVPSLATAPGQWRACRVAFSEDGLPLAGAVPGLSGAYVFSGFTSPFALVPAAAAHFAQWAATGESAIMADLSPARLMS